MVDVTVVDVTANWVVVEFQSENSYVQRRYVPRELFDVTVRGPATVSRGLLDISMEYSNVDLTVVLGDRLPTIRVLDLQDAMRREGLWTVEDYKKNPRAIEGAIKRMIGVDVNTVINAAHGMVMSSD